MSDEHDGEQRKALGEAIESCAETVNRAMLSLLAVSLFSLLTTLGSPDHQLLGIEATVKIPFADDASLSFLGFLAVAPLSVAAVMGYLHVFYGRWLVLERQRQALGMPESQVTLFGIDQWFARGLTALAFYLLGPVTLAVITFKAGVRLEWWLPMAWLTAVVMAALTYLWVHRVQPSRYWRMLIVVPACVVVIGCLVVSVVEAVRYSEPDRWARRMHWERRMDLFRIQLDSLWRPGARLNGADLRRASLKDARLQGAYLGKAKLDNANLEGAKLNGAGMVGTRLTNTRLREANLEHANLARAKMDGTDLTKARLHGANLTGARLSATILHGATLSSATLDGAVLYGVDLTRAFGLECGQIARARLDSTTKLPIQCPKG